jgi:hypothetical protein
MKTIFQFSRGSSNLYCAFKNRNYLIKVAKRYLKFLQSDSSSDWGSITCDDEIGIGLAIEKASTHEGPVIEIGTLFGHTTLLIASKLNPDRHLITIDNYSWNPFLLPPPDHRNFTMRTLRPLLSKSNFELIDSDANQFYRGYSRDRPSMIFIDADHSYDGVKADIDWAVKMNVPVICGHDYCDSSPGVKRAVEETFGASFEVRGSVWIHASA